MAGLTIGGRVVNDGDAIPLNQPVSEISVTIPRSHDYHYTIIIFKRITETKIQVNQFITNLRNGDSRQLLGSPLTGPGEDLVPQLYHFRIYRHILLIPKPEDIAPFISGGILNQEFSNVKGVVLALIREVSFTLYSPIEVGPRFYQLLHAAPDGAVWSFLCEYRLKGDGPWPDNREVAEAAIMQWYNRMYVPGKM